MKSYIVTATLHANTILTINAKNAKEAKDLAIEKHGILDDLWDNADNEEAKITVEKE